MTDKLATLLGDQGNPAGGASPSDGVGDAGGDALKSDNVRLRQRIATLESEQQKALPYIETVVDLLKTEEGRDIVKKLRAGEPLTKKEEKVVTATSEEKPLTRKEMQEILLEHGKGVVSAVAETNRNTQTAAEKNREIEAWADKKFPGFKKLKGTPVWNGNFSAVVGAIQNGTIEIPEGVNPFEVAHERTYHMCVSADPDIVKGKQPSAASTDERLRELMTARKQPAASVIEGEEEKLLKGATEQQIRDLQLARSLGKGSGALAGKSFSNPSANKRRE